MTAVDRPFRHRGAAAVAGAVSTLLLALSPTDAQAAPRAIPLPGGGTDDFLAVVPFGSQGGVVVHDGISSTRAGAWRAIGATALAVGRLGNGARRLILGGDGMHTLDLRS